MGGKDEIADPLAERDSPGLPGREHRVAGLTQGRDERRGLRGLAGAFDPLQRQEEAGQAVDPARRQALRLAARLSPLRGALARFGAAAFASDRARLWPYFAM